VKQGTVSVLFGCHSPVHSTIVLVAWWKLYRRPPKFWQVVCIFLHDLGHWGKQYLDDYEAKKKHWVLGAVVARWLFGQRGYNLVAGHDGYSGQAASELLKPDKYSWIIAPTSWMFINTIFEPKLIRPGCTRRESVVMFKQAMLENWNNGLPEEGHHIYLRQWRGLSRDARKGLRS
jgi:hypothetical protein